MDTPSLSTRYLSVGKLDAVSVAAIENGRQDWQNITIKLTRMDEAVVTTHPHLVGQDDPFKGVPIAGSPYKDEMTPRDRVFVHYKETFRMFDEPVLMQPRRLAESLGVAVGDLPFVAFANRRPNDAASNTYDLLRYKKGETGLITERLAEFNMPDMDVDMEVEIDETLEEQMEAEAEAATEAFSTLNTAMDNYHKNYHQILEVFGIDIGDVSGFSKVYIEQDINGNWLAVRYGQDDPGQPMVESPPAVSEAVMPEAGAATPMAEDHQALLEEAVPNDDAAGAKIDGKRRRISDVDSTRMKPETKRTKSGDLDQSIVGTEQRYNVYTGKNEQIRPEAATVLHTFANEQEAQRSHQKFMQIAFAYSDRPAG